jgi:hypothetical protein
MSDTPETSPAIVAPENHTHFAFVVDGELAWLHSIENNLEGAIATFQSAPTIVEISAEQFVTFLNSAIPPYGNYIWDGSTWALSPDA